MSGLDPLLYRWIAEADDARFTAAFNRYYRAAFPTVLRYLRARASADLADLEEVAQDALLRFFRQIGPERRTAFETFRDAASSLQPLNFGPLHVRQVGALCADAVEYEKAALGASSRDESGLPCIPDRTMILAVRARIPPIQRRGCLFIEDARRHADGSVAETAAQGGSQSQATVGMPEDEALIAAVARAKVFAERLVSAAGSVAESLAQAERRHPGFVRFVQRAMEIVLAAPSLQIPTNGLLFDIASSVFLDACRHRKRIKRGGAGDDNHTIETIWSDADAEDHDGFPSIDSFGPPPRNFHEPSTNPHEHFENEECMEKFLLYLRAPLVRATEEYESARTRGSAATAERKRVDSLSRKLERTLSVVSMVGEGFTQEQVAEKLGLSRNQVKYVLEVVEQTFQRFVNAGSRGKLTSDHAEVPTDV